MQHGYQEAELLRLTTPNKDSRNSSIPPSQDPFRFRHTESLRVKSGKRQGGQSGHSGSTLEMSSTPDIIVNHEPEYCYFCGGSLAEITSEYSGRRQIIDIPPVKAEITEHRIFRKRCTCGHCTESSYPLSVHSPVCYGESVMSLTAYMHARQYIPFDRMRKVFHDVFGLPISSGTLVNIVSTFASNGATIYAKIKEKLLKSEVVGADETGVCVNGKNHWAWTF